MEDDICVKTSHSRWTSLRKKKGLQLISGGREQWNTMRCRVLRLMKLSRPMPGMGFRQDGKAKRKETCLLRFYKDVVLNYKKHFVWGGARFKEGKLGSSTRIRIGSLPLRCTRPRASAFVCRD